MLFRSKDRARERRATWDREEDQRRKQDGEEPRPGTMASGPCDPQPPDLHHDGDSSSLLLAPQPLAHATKSGVENERFAFSFGGAPDIDTMCVRCETGRDADVVCSASRRMSPAYGRCEVATIEVTERSKE